MLCQASARTRWVSGWLHWNLHQATAAWGASWWLWDWPCSNDAELGRLSQRSQSDAWRTRLSAVSPQSISHCWLACALCNPSRLAQVRQAHPHWFKGSLRGGSPISEREQGIRLCKERREVDLHCPIWCFLGCGLRPRRTISHDSNKRTVAYSGRLASSLSVVLAFQAREVHQRCHISAPPASVAWLSWWVIVWIYGPQADTPRRYATCLLLIREMPCQSPSEAL